MKPARQYATASAFRIALETRLKLLAQADGIDLQRLRRQVSFDRLLARLFSEPNAPWLLKGGYAMELRLRSARSTKDIDLSFPAGAEQKGDVLERLQDRAATDMGDYFIFNVGLPQMDLDGAPEGGNRYPVQASLAGRVFTKFHLDIGIGDAIVPPTELVSGRDWLGFAGIPLVPYSAISKEQQFAEKFHAYTRPREAPNSRVKDLVDMALLVRMGTMERSKLREAIQTTFDRRGSHRIPSMFPNPPESWRLPYSQLAKECGLDWSIEASGHAIEAQVSEIWQHTKSEDSAADR